MDKAGNFIGWLHIEGVNLSVALVEQALSRVHFTAERSPYCKALLAAQDAAKQRKEKVWSHYEETPVEEVVPVLEEKERTANYKPVFVTEITDDLHFYVQDVETGTRARVEKVESGGKVHIFYIDYGNFADSKSDVGLGLVKEGLVMVEPRKERQFQKVITEYLNAQEAAKSARLNLWRYGDFRADDADEFGYSR
ncbi:hypothetical protein DUI87_33427 [Hirundo rustica rustica]|uniref:TNase-like domain-containing protein n=1 Tax=Hirundo rustica rustica TaxID=333673 RepID=A0A3M0IP72_HIRRU|nr:hypothetical protein DUI87_33427 [Hirundo rustica rustica]